jgi:hypothetical protein
VFHAVSQKTANRQIPISSCDKALESSKQDDVRSLLLQLNEVHKVLPKERDVISFSTSSNYGFVRPILHEIAQYEVDALPVLIDFLDNGNYLYSQTGVGNMAPGQVMACTIGSEARKLFISLVDPTGGGISYKGRKGMDGKVHICPIFYPSSNDLKEWWRNHSRMTLLEIQTEILGDRIEQEKKIGFPGENDKATYLEPLLKLKTQLPITRINYYLKPNSPVISTETKPPVFNNPPINKANR